MTSASSRNRRGERGLTLVELLVVLLIIGLIAAFAVPQVMNYLGGARQDSAAIQINQLSGILDLYRLDVGRYPSASEGLDALLERPSGADGWNGPYVRKADSLVDPWGNPYQYRVPGQHGDFDLYSLGADGTEGGEGEDADVVSW
ncbi:MAG TPA: type II secretion system major pseudopilin GspG [Thermohalobaculum sp.]|nr:type II secretion system major pseudopilin GspG [Thermohalobaculum sp.]